MMTEPRRCCDLRRQAAVARFASFPDPSFSLPPPVLTSTLGRR